MQRVGRELERRVEHPLLGRGGWRVAAHTAPVGWIVRARRHAVIGRGLVRKDDRARIVAQSIVGKAAAVVITAR